MARKGGLGKGLDALFIDNDTGVGSGAVTVRLSEVEPNKNQPRKDFDENALAELADSIRQHGVLQPLLVRPQTNGGYQIVAGERRWRASRMAGLSEIPVVIREMSDTETMEIGLIENLQREDLNPVEEAMGYRELMDVCGLTQDEVASRVGKSRPAVANALRLLRLPDQVMQLVRSGEISAGHARALLALEDTDRMAETAKKIAKGELTVRDVERLGKRQRDAASEPSNRRSRESYYHEMEIALSEQLGRKVQIHISNQKGTLQIEFYNKEELSELAQRLSGDEK